MNMEGKQNHKSQSSIKEYKCDICDKILSSKKSLWSHNNGVHGNNKYKCGSCHKIFTSSQMLKMHTSTVHENVTNQYHKCDACDKSFSQAGTLKLSLIHI